MKTFTYDSLYSHCCDDVMINSAMHCGAWICDCGKRKVLSNSLEINFIHDDMCSRSCKNTCIFYPIKYAHGFIVHFIVLLL